MRLRKDGVVGKDKKKKEYLPVRVDVNHPSGMYTMQGDLTLERVLSMTCAEPEDFGDYLQWQRDVKLGHGPDWYQGTMRYRINLHCADMWIQAHRDEHNQLIIHGYFVQDH